MHPISGKELMELLTYLGTVLVIIALVFLGLGYLTAYILKKYFKCLQSYDTLTITMFTTPIIIIIVFCYDTLLH